MVGWWVTASLAATVEVTTTSGASVFDDLCSLPEAVHLANNGTDDGYGCLPAKDYGPVTITFPGITGTITLTSDLVLLPRFGPLVIEGPGADVLTLDFAGAGSVETGGNGEVVTLRGLTVTHGTPGLRLFGDDTVTVEDCRFLDNTAVGNGGAIRSQGTLTVVRSLFSGNSCGGSSINDGGAIWTEGQLTVLDSAFFGNTAEDRGGAILVGADGIGRIVNSTISGNTAESGGGIEVLNAFGDPVGPNVAIVNTTIVGNTALYEGGGLEVSAGYALSGVAVRGSVVAGNGAPVGPDCSNSDGGGGTVTSGGHNLLGVSDRCSVVPGAGDAAGTSAAPLDPLLAPLAENGSILRTHRPLAGSPLIDASPDCADELGAPLGHDQRGFARDALCDIGAHELVCGDGVVDAAETCDDGDANSDTAPDACRTSCVPASCGDGIVDAGEACDSDDGSCTAECTIPATTTDTTDTAGDPPCCKAEPGCRCAATDVSAGWALLLAAAAWGRRRR